MWMFFNFFQEDSFYPAMRLLLPALEKERVAYGIKEVRNDSWNSDTFSKKIEIFSNQGDSDKHRVDLFRVIFLF